VLKNMRTTRSFTMVAALVAAGFLILATISGAAFATCSNGHGGDSSGGGGGSSTSAGATSSISQSNTQSATCTAGTSNTGSCNQLAINWNTGNAVSAAQAASDPVPGFPTVSATAGSSISQSDIQTATCTAGTFNDHSCNQAAANVNFGNAVSAAIASFGR
jgi:hypothetical protein